MITATHMLVYGEDPEATRAFFRDVLQWPYADTGGGWLIFASGPSEVGCHPSSWEYEGTTGGTDQRFDVSLMCDDLEATMTELTGRGATFDGESVPEPWPDRPAGRSRSRDDDALPADVRPTRPGLTVAVLGSETGTNFRTPAAPDQQLAPVPCLGSHRPATGTNFRCPGSPR